MKNFIYQLFLSIVLISFCYGCSKTAVNPQTNAGMGEYIEFKIDGRLYRMEEQQVGVDNTDFIIGAARPTGPTSGKYGLQIAFAHSTQDEGAGILILDNEPVTKSHYDLNQVDFSSMFSYIMPNRNQYMLTDLSAGSIDFTNIDTAFNHEVVATFQISNLELWDKDGNVISTGHTLTDGKIKTKIE